MAKEKYNHNYQHCTGKGCELANDCLYHLAYIEAVKLNLKKINVQDRCNNAETEYVRVRIG